MLRQLRYFASDYRSACGRRRSRALYLWMSRAVVGVATYRFERGMYESLGKSWEAVRLGLLPILNLSAAYSNTEINYHAEIGPGLKILHPSLGVVVSGRARIGKGLVLVGGNCIGMRANVAPADAVILGDDVQLGAGATVLGPAALGSRVSVGSMACVLRDAADGSVLVGVPAKPSRSGRQR